MKNNEIIVREGLPIEDEITVPGDKSISHRALMLAALTNGPCKITGFLEGEDCLSTLGILRKLGVEIERPEPTMVVVHGCRGKFRAPDGDLDCGNSGTTMRLMAGLLAAQPFSCRLIGDASLSRRPMRRVIEPLMMMGARVQAEHPSGFPPLIVEGGELKGICYRSPVASAQVKSAVLLAGLFAHGLTRVIEPAPSRDHTERMLGYFLADLRREVVEDGVAVTVAGQQHLESRDLEVPGDISSAAFWLVAAGARPGSRLLIRGVGLNPTRTGILSALVRMGAHIREVVEEPGAPEPMGSLEVTGAPLHGIEIGGAEVANLIDELPVLAVAGALASGTMVVRDATELRVKETDRIQAVTANLRAMGAVVEERPDGFAIQGGQPLQGAELESFGDHRIAMAFAVAGLFAKGRTTIRNTACVETSYPGFEQTLEVFQSRRRRPALPYVSLAARGTSGLR